MDWTLGMDKWIHKVGRRRAGGRGERLLTYFNHHSCAAVESPAVHALRPWAHAWPISLRSKRARFSKTYGLNNASALFPQGWTGWVAEKKKKESEANVRSIYFLFVYYDCIRARVCVCVCVPVGSLWVCLFGTSVSTGQLASAQCQSLWLDSERGSL